MELLPGVFFLKIIEKFVVNGLYFCVRLYMQLFLDLVL